MHWESVQTSKADELWFHLSVSGVGVKLQHFGQVAFEKAEPKQIPLQ